MILVGQGKSYCSGANDARPSWYISACNSAFPFQSFWELDSAINDMSTSGVNLAITKDGETYNKLSRPDDYLASTQLPPPSGSAVPAISGSKRKHEHESASETKRAKTGLNASRSKVRGRANDEFREPGVRSVLPGLEGEEHLTDESIDEAVAYLRSVR